jgi:hypothetical protein
LKATTELICYMEIDFLVLYDSATHFLRKPFTLYLADKKISVSAIFIYSSNYLSSSSFE